MSEHVADCDDCPWSETEDTLPEAQDAALTHMEHTGHRVPDPWQTSGPEGGDPA